MPQGGTPQRRRRLLLGAGGWALASPLPSFASTAARPRVVVVGAGWAGLAAVHALAALGEFDLHLVDRTRAFRALPLSNPWLAGWTGERLPRIELAAWARRHGARFSAATATALERGARTVRIASGDGGAAEALRYDFLLLAAGAVPDPAAWFGGDEAAATEARTRFPGGFVADELDALKRGLEAFTGGTLVMTVPPPPLRCPPAPYERALLVAAALKRRGVRARLVVLDAGGGMPRLNRLLATAGGGTLTVEHLRHQRLQRVDPFARRLVSDDGELTFEHALLLPPLRAAALFGDAGLAEPSTDGRPGGRWASVEPLTLRARADERIWFAGDALGDVSPLFGGYPKTAQIAAETGAAAARQIAAAARGAPPPAATLPASECHVWTAAEPREALQLDVQHRLRADGVIVQNVRQTEHPMPADEDLAWARALLASRLGISG